MPITIKVVSEADYATWLGEVRSKPDVYKMKEAPPARQASVLR